MSSGSTDQSDGAAERSAHVTRGSNHAVSHIDPFVGPDYGPIKLRAVAVLEGEVEELRGERDHLLALLKVEREASFKAGAEAMRETAAECADECWHEGVPYPHAAAAIRALPLPERDA